MGVFAGPEISSDGLVLALDAGNSKGFDDDENLLTYSEQFDNGAWSKVSTTVSANATVAPDGTLTADNVTNTPNSLSYLAQVKSGLSTTTTYTVSAYVKPLTTNKVVAFEWGGAWRSFNLSNLTDTGGGGTGQITVLDNGWYRISHTVTNVTSFNVIYIGAYGTTADTVTVALWGAQLEISSSPSPYYPTTGTAKNRGTTLIDLTGRSNNGTLTNGPTYSSANGGSIVFDGTDDYVINSSTTNIPTGNSSRTIQLWVYPKADTNNFIQLGTGGGGNQVYIVEFYNISGTRYLFTDGINGGNNLTISGSQLPTLNAWNHIIFGNSGQNWFYYLNGVSQASGTWGTTINTIGQKYIIGKRDDYGANTTNGNIAQVSIYNRALTAAEIQQNFNATRGRYGI